jgi:3-hydroxyisobutyrate dehydrogenase-like beta-hydroxyacid dehydrogenase
MHCKTVILSLPDDTVVRRLLEQTESWLQPGHLIIDTSTGDPSAACHWARTLAPRSIEYIDATISGSSSQLQSGEAVLFVGATEPAFQAAVDILESLSTKIHHVGPPGSGSQMKLVSNLILGLNRAALAEGLALADRMGLNLEKTLDLLRGSLAYSRIMDTKGMKMIQRDYRTQARLSQHLKDVRILLKNGRQFGIDLPLTMAHQEKLEQAVAMGFGDLDNSAVFESFLVRQPAEET